jgi:hypothetical protein
MKKREHIKRVALVDLYNDKLISSLWPEMHGRKQYWKIRWSGESECIKTAVGSTKAFDSSLKAQFGIQDELLRQDIVAEIVLVHKEWPWFYRIPARVFRDYSMTRDGDRRVFQVTWDGEIRSEQTRPSISISAFQRERNSIVEIRIQM